MAKNVQANLIGIKFLESDDSGTNMEVYGDLFVRRVIVNELGDFQSLETRHLWHRPEDQAVDIAPNTIFTINNVGNVTIHPGEFLWLGGHLAEEDDWPDANDNLGFIDRKFPHDAVASGPVDVLFADRAQGGQRVHARYVLTVTG